MPDIIRNHYVGLLDREEFSDLRISVVGIYERSAGHHAYRDDVTEYQVAYCVEGEGRIRAAGREMPVRRGDVFINIPGIPHEYWADDKHPWTLLWAHFVGSAGERYFRMMGCHAEEPAFHLGMNDRLVDLFKMMIREVRQPARANQMTAVAYLHLILSTITALRSQRPATVGERLRCRLDVDSLTAYIDANLGSLNLSDLAAEAAVSVPHFERLFREQTGYSPFKYVLRRRVALASQLLLSQQEQGIKEIARRVGYDDQHYFSRVFKKITALSPTQYRRTYGGGR